MAELQSQVLNDITLTTSIADADQVRKFVNDNIRELSGKSDENDAALSGNLTSWVDGQGYLVSEDVKISYDGEERRIVLSSGNAVTSVDCGDFIKDGMISDVYYDEGSHTLSILWNSDGGSKTTEINLSGLVDVYTAGEGLTCENGVFSLTADIPAPVTVDSALSETSENPVQNKAVKAAIDAKCSIADVTALEADRWTWTSTGYIFINDGIDLPDHDDGNRYFTAGFEPDDGYQGDGTWKATLTFWEWDDNPDSPYYNAWGPDSPEFSAQGAEDASELLFSNKSSLYSVTAARIPGKNAHGLARLVDLPTKTSQLQNDGSDGEHPYISQDDVETALSGKADISSTVLNPIYDGNGEQFSEWTYVGLNDFETVISMTDNGDGTWTLITSEREYTDFQQTSPTLVNFDNEVTATRTENHVIGYTLGDQDDKPLQPKGDYELTANMQNDVSTIVTASETEWIYPDEINGYLYAPSYQWVIANGDRSKTYYNIETPVYTEYGWHVHGDMFFWFDEGGIWDIASEIDIDVDAPEDAKYLNVPDEEHAWGAFTIIRDERNMLGLAMLTDVQAVENQLSDYYTKGVFDACLSAVRQYGSPEEVPLSAVVNSIWCLSKLQQRAAE